MILVGWGGNRICIYGWMGGITQTEPELWMISCIAYKWEGIDTHSLLEMCLNSWA